MKHHSHMTKILMKLQSVSGFDSFSYGLNAGSVWKSSEGAARSVVNGKCFGEVQKCGEGCMRTDLQSTLSLSNLSRARGWTAAILARSDRSGGQFPDQPTCR